MQMREKRTVPHTSYTRGFGVFENTLARLRTKKVLKLIGGKDQNGSILDIGCGTVPYFLLTCRFAEKVGIDKQIDVPFERERLQSQITFIARDLQKNPHIPFEADRFDVVTMLAVFEHIEKQVMKRLLEEIRRVLKPEGIVVITTPAPWTDRLLKILGWLRLVSSEEVKEHVHIAGYKTMIELFQSAGFERSCIRHGTFMICMNTWTVGEK
jgi:SAM-dependent methyltransferase